MQANALTREGTAQTPTQRSTENFFCYSASCELWRACESTKTSSPSLNLLAKRHACGGCEPDIHLLNSYIPTFLGAGWSFLWLAGFQVPRATLHVRYTVVLQSIMHKEAGVLYHPCRTRDKTKPRRGIFRVPES